MENKIIPKQLYHYENNKIAYVNAIAKTPKGSEVVIFTNNESELIVEKVDDFLSKYKLVKSLKVNQ